MNLVSAAERFAAMDRSAIVLDSAGCLHSLDRNSACEACFGVCPVQAITPGKPPVLDGQKCESCLACLTVCPVGAYSADDAVQQLLNAAAHVESGTLELVCAKNPQPEQGLSETSTGIQVKGCLAGLGTGAYVALVPFGQEHIVARAEACSACPWAVLQPQIEAQVACARSLLSAWEKAETVSVCRSAECKVERPVRTADNPPLSRRDLLRMMARQGQVAMARAMENGTRKTGHRPGRDRLRILAGEAHLPSPKETARVRPGQAGFATVSISDACTACGACSRGCPTGALRIAKDEEETRFSLRFSARLCVGCDLCARVCVPLALAVDHDPSFGDVFGLDDVQLIEGELIRCKRCGTLTAKRGDREICELCEMRRTNPFGSILPPGFKMGPHGLEKV